MRPTVYIETTISSYYFDQRPELAQDIQRTRGWWDPLAAGIFLVHSID